MSDFDPRRRLSDSDIANQSLRQTTWLDRPSQDTSTHPVNSSWSSASSSSETKVGHKIDAWFARTFAGFWWAFAILFLSPFVIRALLNFGLGIVRSHFVWHQILYDIVDAPGSAIAWIVHSLTSFRIAVHFSKDTTAFIAFGMLVFACALTSLFPFFRNRAPFYLLIILGFIYVAIIGALIDR